MSRRVASGAPLYKWLMVKEMNYPRVCRNFTGTGRSGTLESTPNSQIPKWQPANWELDSWELEVDSSGN